MRLKDERRLDMKEEDKLMKKYGTKNPFTVPDNYFDNLTNEIMEKLPEKKEIPMEEKETSTWIKIRPWLYMAAMFIAILLPIRYMINSTSSDQTAITATNNEYEHLSDEYIDAIMDHSMMDDYTLYQYLTDADTDTYYN